MRAWLRRRRERTDERVLDAIEQLGDMAYGVGISRAASLGPWRVLPSLDRLERSGRIIARWEANPGDRPPRRLYSVVPGARGPLQ